LDQVGVKVLGVDHHSPSARVVDEDGDRVVIGFGLGEGVEHDDIDGVVDGVR
jgi:hypothetical protein